MKSFLAGTVVATVLVVATLFAYDIFRIDSSSGYWPKPQVEPASSV